MQPAPDTGRSRPQNFTAYSTGNSIPSPGYDWARMHAAAVDRCLVDRASKVDVAPFQHVSKRTFDLILAFVLIAALSPLLVFIAWAARRDGGPILFGHRRIGHDGRTFICWKFRTMVMNADCVLQALLARDPAARAEWQETYKLKNDPRVTPIGRFLRTTSLDELPQLFNVIKGEMSLVGPRPIVNDEIVRYGVAFHDYSRCRPGITGLWQVSGRSDCDYGNRVRLDQQYSKTCSLGTDLVVLWKTVFVVIQRRGAY